MAERPTIQVANWEKFQHYRKRNPPWIRLYRDLIDRPEWRNLSDAAGRLLIEIWLLSSETQPGGRVPYDLNLLAWRTGRASADASTIASALEELEAQGFIRIIHSDASTDASTNASADASTTTPQSTETEKKPPSEAKKKSRKIALPTDWHPNETHERIAAEEGVSMKREATVFRDHAAANGRRQVDWDAAFCNWLRKAAELKGNGVSLPVPTGKKYHLTPEQAREYYPDPE